MTKTGAVILSIITVSYNTLDYTLQTLKTALAEINRSPLLKNRTEIFVVDNHSQDGSVQACEKFLAAQTGLSSYKVFANQDNLGFAKANNQATQVSQGKYVLLLNSDTITLPGSLEHLVQVFEAYPLTKNSADLASAGNKIDKLGLLSPTLLNPDSSIQYQGGDLPSLGTVFAQMSFLDDLPLIGQFLPSTQHTGKTGNSRQAKYNAMNLTSQQQFQDIISMGWIGGTAMCIRRELIEDIGMLDGNIFMYGEDIEYCLRAKHHHWDIAIDPLAKITHFGQASSSSKNAILGEFKGYLYIWSKHFPAWQLPWLKLILKLGATLRILFYKLTHQPKPATIYLEASQLIK